MDLRWTRHVKDKEEKEKLEASIKHNKWVLELLGNILEQMDKECASAEVSPKNYDQPNWEYRAADGFGYRRCLNSIRKLINLDHKETK